MVPLPNKLPVPTELVVTDRSTLPVQTEAVVPEPNKLQVMTEPVVWDPNKLPVLTTTAGRYLLAVMAGLAVLEPKRLMVAVVVAVVENVNGVVTGSVTVSEDILAAFGTDCSG